MPRDSNPELCETFCSGGVSQCHSRAHRSKQPNAAASVELLRFPEISRGLISSVWSCPNGRLMTGWNLQKAACGQHLTYQTQAQNTAEGQESNIPLLLVVRRAVAEKSDTVQTFRRLRERPNSSEQFGQSSRQFPSSCRAVRELFGTVRHHCSELFGLFRDLQQIPMWLRCGVRK